MTIALLFGIIAAILFCFGFFSKRRFGVLGMALAVGVVLDNLLSKTLEGSLDGSLTYLSAFSVSSLVLIIAPALVVSIRAPRYYKKMARVLGSIGFTILAIAFIIEPLGHSLVLVGQDKMMYEAMLSYRDIAIIVGLTGAVVDVLLMNLAKK